MRRLVSCQLSTCVLCWRQLHTAASSHSASGPEKVAPLPSWVLCGSVAEAHALASIIVHHHLDILPHSVQRRTISLSELVSCAQEIKDSLTAAIHVPRDVTMIEDLPMFLAETLRGSGATQRSSNGGLERFTQMSEEDILFEFDEWVIGSLAPSERPRLFGDPTQDAAGAEVDTMPYLQLMSLLQSYVRYHSGVAWGAAQPVAREEVAAYHRRAYLLHPWHGVYCPEGRAQQMPYVHVLQWMTDVAGGSDLFKEHRATQPFQPPSASLSPTAAAEGGKRFRALDVCSQSGFGVDLLLKAGAEHVVAVDTSAAALGNTEATVREHMRERRSRNLGGEGRRPRQREVEVQRWELLPEVTVPPASKGGTPRAENGIPNDKATSTAAATAASSLFASAAARRRQLARGLGRAYEQQQQQQQARVDRRAVGPWDVLYYHPPTPSALPLVALPACPPTTSVWWRLAQAELHRRCREQAAPVPSLLPFLLAPTDTASGSRHAHHSLAVLEQFVERLRGDATPPAQGRTEGHAALHPTQAPLLQDGGYVVCVLPRSYEPAGDVAHFAAEQYRSAGRNYHGSGAGDALSDFVVAQLDGFYDVVLRRRHFQGPSSGQGQHRSDGTESLPLLLRYACGADKTVAEAVGRQLVAFMGSQWWTDVLVLRKRRHAEPAQATRVLHSTQRHRGPAVPNAVAWEDSFEHNEYKPRSAPTTRYHWTDLVPTYSYLEDDFFDSKDTGRAAPASNFLAVGHPPELHRTRTGAADAARASTHTTPGAVSEAAAAADNFKNVFAEELRHRRRSKLRKMAFAPIEQQEWYIDEKLIKSEAAKVDFMNELSRWDFQDYDN